MLVCTSVSSYSLLERESLGMHLACMLKISFVCAIFCLLLQSLCLSLKHIYTVHSLLSPYSTNSEGNAYSLTCTSPNFSFQTSSHTNIFCFGDIATDIKIECCTQACHKNSDKNCMMVLPTTFVMTKVM